VRRPPILEEVRDALGLPRTPGADPLEQVVLALSEQPALLILDNFEHLVEGGAPLVQVLLQRVATLTILVASRRRLNLAGEQEFPVLPLPVPATGDSDPWGHRGEAKIPVSVDKSAAVGLTADLHPCSAAVLPPTSNPSIQLFTDRAQQARADFALTPGNAADVARLCARLEGIPLAIELAAGRAGVLTPGQILERLSDPFTLLVSRKHGVEERHHSLRATLDWSYRLLPAELQQFFTGLSIFRGGWTLEAAAAVCQTTEALQYLEQLRECSLIVVEEAKGEIRYRLLETLREYGAERLAPAEQEALAERHAAFFLALAEQAERRMHRPERYCWLARLEPERDNLRAALAWCLGSAIHEGPPEHLNTRTPEPLTMGLRLAAALAEFWAHSGHAGEGRDWLERLLERAGGLGRSAVRARALGAAGYLAGKQYDEAGARPLLEESVALWRELADPAGMVGPLCHLGLWNVYQREFAPARALLEECVALARALGDRWMLAAAVDNLGRLAEFEGDLAGARAHLEEARLLNPEVGAEETLASILYRLGCVAQGEGHLEEAREWYEQSMVVTCELPAADQTCALRELGQVERLRGNYAAARTRLEECLALRQRLGHSTFLPSALSQLAEVMLCQGEFPAARALAEQGLALARAGADPSFTVGPLRVLGRAAYRQGELQQARKRLEEALSCPGERGHPLVAIDLAEVLAGLGEFAQARAHFAQSLTTLRSSRNPLGLSHLLRTQGRVELRLGEWPQAAALYQESLSLLQERGVREGVPDCLEGLAGVVLATGVRDAACPVDEQPATGDETEYRLLEPSRCMTGARFAARLLGAAEALRAAMGAPLPPVYWSDHERMVACLRMALNEEELAAEWAKGQAMSPEQATAAALASVGPADSGSRAAGADP
jgi:predicted ATPase